VLETVYGVSETQYAGIFATNATAMALTSLLFRVLVSRGGVARLRTGGFCYSALVELGPVEVGGRASGGLERVRHRWPRRSRIAAANWPRSRRLASSRWLKSGNPLTTAILIGVAPRVITLMRTARNVLISHSSVSVMTRGRSG
jgi:hypothetical protein